MFLTVPNKKILTHLVSIVLFYATGEIRVIEANDINDML